MKSFLSHNFIKFLLGIFILVSGSTYAHAAAVNITVPNTDKLYVVQLKHGTNLAVSNGKWDFESQLSIYGTDLIKDTYYRNNISHNIKLKFKLRGSRSYIADMIPKLSTGGLLPNSSNEYEYITTFNPAGGFVDPGKYTVDALLNDKVLLTYDLCLKSFKGASGITIGNETCGQPPVTPIVGKCNETFTTQAQSAITDAQKTSICTTGTLASFTGTGPWTWKCLGNNNAVSTDDDTCTAQKKSTETPPGTPVVGKCNEVLTSTAQTSIKEADSLCTSGTKVGFTGSGPWTWKCLGDNTAVDTDDVTCTAQMKNTVTIPPGGTATTKQCADGSQDCYELSGGFSQALGALGTKISSIGSADSLGGFLNAIIAFGIAIGGVITVVFLMWEGVNYMRSDNAETKSKMKSRMLNTVLGFILLLSIYTLLRTINPDLLNLMPRIDSATLDNIPDRSNDADFQKNLDELDVTVGADLSDYTDTTFLIYLYHQQGPGGAPSILWAAKQGFSSVPAQTPFIKGDASKINRNMRNNIYPSDMQKVIGTTEVTPANFLKYWRKKVEAAKLSTRVIDPAIERSVLQAASSTKVPADVMKAMCRIESGCRKPPADGCNSFGYCGLFQVSKGVFKEHGTGSNILDYYSNAYTGGMYAQYNQKIYQKNKSTIGY